MRENFGCEDLGDFMKTEQDSTRAGVRHQEYLVWDYVSGLGKLWFGFSVLHFVESKMYEE